MRGRRLLRPPCVRPGRPVVSIRSAAQLAAPRRAGAHSPLALVPDRAPTKTPREVRCTAECRKGVRAVVVLAAPAQSSEGVRTARAAAQEVAALCATAAPTQSLCAVLVVLAPVQSPGGRDTGAWSPSGSGRTGVHTPLAVRTMRAPRVARTTGLAARERRVMGAERRDDRVGTPRSPATSTERAGSARASVEGTKAALDRSTGRRPRRPPRARATCAGRAWGSSSSTTVRIVRAPATLRRTLRISTTRVCSSSVTVRASTRASCFRPWVSSSGAAA